MIAVTLLRDWRKVGLHSRVLGKPSRGDAEKAQQKADRPLRRGR